tara:strand:- start:376 stop:555 length:180 start_codon:yes stop_codon:yes gene_type:complete
VLAFERCIDDDIICSIKGSAIFHIIMQHVIKTNEIGEPIKRFYRMFSKTMKMENLIIIL